MHCVFYVVALVASVVAASPDPCPPKPTCGRVDCYNEWVDCFGQLGKPGMPTDITGYLNGNHAHEAQDASLGRSAVNYPTKVAQRTTVIETSKLLDPWRIWFGVQTLSNFTNRYHDTGYGEDSTDWLFTQVLQTLKGTQATATMFGHKDPEVRTIIAKIPGQSIKTIVVGAHQDSAGVLTANGSSADDGDDDAPSPRANESILGCITILEALRVLLTNWTIASGEAPYAIEFHWYGENHDQLSSSSEIFDSYSQANRSIVAMLSQDQAGITNGSDFDKSPAFGIVTDYTDKGLSKFVSLIIKEYTSIPGRRESCGYACSDHASATRARYASAYVRDSKDTRSYSSIGSGHDRFEKINATHMLEHGKLVVGFAMELAFADLK